MNNKMSFHLSQNKLFDRSQFGRLQIYLSSIEYCISQVLLTLHLRIDVCGKLGSFNWLDVFYYVCYPVILFPYKPYRQLHCHIQISLSKMFLTIFYIIGLCLVHGQGYQQPALEQLRLRYDVNQAPQMNVIFPFHNISLCQRGNGFINRFLITCSTNHLRNTKLLRRL